MKITLEQLELESGDVGDDTIERQVTDCHTWISIIEISARVRGNFQRRFPNVRVS